MALTTISQRYLFREEGVVAQYYSSFLMRLWCLEGGELRIKLEHIQSGEKVQVETLAEVLAWVERRAQGPPKAGVEAKSIKAQWR